MAFDSIETLSGIKPPLIMNTSALTGTENSKNKKPTIVNRGLRE
jgi:hypothetical protein